MGFITSLKSMTNEMKTVWKYKTKNDLKRVSKSSMRRYSLFRSLFSMERSKPVILKKSSVVLKSALHLVNNCLASRLETSGESAGAVTSAVKWATLPWSVMTCLPSIRLWG